MALRLELLDDGCPRVKPLIRHQAHRLVFKTDEEIVLHGVPCHVDHSEAFYYHIVPTVGLLLVNTAWVGIEEVSLAIARLQEEDLAVIETHCDDVLARRMALQHSRLPLNLGEHNCLGPLCLQVHNLEISIGLDQVEHIFVEWVPLCAEDVRLQLGLKLDRFVLDVPND